MKATFKSDIKGKNFLSVAAFILTILLIKTLDVLRVYITEKFPQYIPENTVTLPEKVILVLMAAAAAVYVVFILIFLPMWYKTISYTITDYDIITDTGLISKTHRIMKLSAIQNVTRISFPLGRYTGFNFIAVNALGGRLLLMFMSVSDCKKIMTLLDEKNREFFEGKSREKELSEAVASFTAASGRSSEIKAAPIAIRKADTPSVKYTSSYDDDTERSPYVQLEFDESEQNDGSVQLTFGDVGTDSMDGNS